MNRIQRSLLPAMAFVVLLVLQSVAITALGQAPGQGQRPSLPPIPIKGDTTHTLSKHFTPVSGVKKNPNAGGFIQRWLVLEPVKKDIAGIIYSPTTTLEQPFQPIIFRTITLQ